MKRKRECGKARNEKLKQLQQKRASTRKNREKFDIKRRKKGKKKETKKERDKGERKTEKEAERQKQVERERLIRRTIEMIKCVNKWQISFQLRELRDCESSEWDTQSAVVCIVDQIDGDVIEVCDGDKKIRERERERR